MCRNGSWSALKNQGLWIVCHFICTVCLHDIPFFYSKAYKSKFTALDHGIIFMIESCFWNWVSYKRLNTTTCLYFMFIYASHFINYHLCLSKKRILSTVLLHIIWSIPCVPYHRMLGCVEILSKTSQVWILECWIYFIIILYLSLCFICF